MRVAFLMSLLLVSLSTFARTAAAADARSAPVASAAEAAADPADEEALLRELGQLDRFVRGRLHMARWLAEAGRLAEQAPRLRRDSEWLRAALRHLRGEAEWLEEDRRDAIARKVRALRLQVGNLTRALEDDRAAQALAGLDQRPAAGAQVVVEAGLGSGCASALAVGAGTFAGRLGGSAPASPAEVWFRYTAPRAGLVTATTAGSDFDTELTVYGGCPGSKASKLAANDDAFGLQAAISFAVAAGEERLVRLRGVAGAEGLFLLQLGFGGGIAGTVTNAVGGAPLADVEVAVWSSLGFYAGSGFSGGTGSYVVGGLDPGTYFAGTFNGLGFIDELYNDIPCPGGPFSGCDPFTGTPIQVQAGTTTGGINFGLRLGGAITGRVRAAATGLAIPGASVDLYRQSGQWIAETVTDVAGRYRFNGLTGTYFARASSFEYQAELYREIPCPLSACNPTTGTPIAVSLGATTTAVDFTLDRLGSIAGNLTDAVSSAPIVNAFVEVDDSSGNLVGYGISLDNGRYQVGGLPAGTYYARSLNFQDYVDELYDDLPCPSSCDPTTGTPIAVSLDATTSGVDFALDPGGKIAGRLTDASTGDPLGGIFFNFVPIWDAGGELVSFGHANEAGNYLAPGLATGSYFATTSVNYYFNELYDDLPCGPPTGCDPTTGTPIPVTANMTTPGIDFALTPLGKISGILTDAVSGSPLSAAFVQAWDTSGFPVSGTQTDSSGTYTLIGFANGSYFVTTATGDHFNELYDNLPCGNSCNPTVGTPVPTTVGAVTAGVDFALDRLGAISGTVIDAASGLPLVGIFVAVTDANGFFVNSSATDTSGKYTVPALDPGTHYAITNAFGDYIDELFDNLPCPFGSCNPTTGTPIMVSLNATTTGIDFALVPASAIAGKVTASNGTPLPGVAIDLWTSAGDYVYSTATNATGRYLVFLDTGTYFVSTDNGLGGLDEIYDNVPCPLGSAYDGLCDPTTGTPVPVIEGMPAATGIDFVLSRIPIFRDGFESGNTSHWSSTVP